MAESTTSTTQVDPFFYYETLRNPIPDHTSIILEQYSGVSKDKQEEHVLNVRNRAYKSHPYPCLGRFRFLELDLSSYSIYESYILPTLRKADSEETPIFLDLGTCLGQDIRKLIFDGVDPSRLYGSDIVSDFIDSGYELFNDEAKMPRDHFLYPADVFDNSESNPLRKLYSKVDILHATAVFHLFSIDEQPEIARQCLRLLKRDPNMRSLAVGGQAGNINATESVRNDGAKRYRHNGDSWRQLWEQVCNEDEFKAQIKSLEVKVEMEDWTRWKSGQGDQSAEQKHIGQIEDGFRWMVWQVWVQF